MDAGDYGDDADNKVINEDDDDDDDDSTRIQLMGRNQAAFISPIPVDKTCRRWRQACGNAHRCISDTQLCA